MNIQVQGIAFPLSDDLIAFAGARFAGLVRHIAPPHRDQARLRITLDAVSARHRHEAARYRVTACLHLPGTHVVADVREADPRRALTRLRDKLERALRERYERRQQARRCGARRAKHDLHGASDVPTTRWAS